MATRAELEQQAATQQAVVAASWTQVQASWAGLGLTEATVQTGAAVEAIRDLLTDVVSVWGEVSGTVAADFYESLRELAVPTGPSFTVVVPDPVNPAQIDGISRWAINGSANETPTPESVLAKLEGPMQRIIRQAERAVIENAAARDPARARVARVPSGAKTCAFCLVAASRGYVYRSFESAGQGRDWHNFCDCTFDISWDRVPVPPEGYDPGELYGKYEQAREAATGSSLRSILKQLRLQEGIH